MSKRHIALFLCLMLVPVLLYARTEGHFDRTLQVSGAISVDVSTPSGEINVTAGGANQVEIHAKIHSNGWPFGSDDAVHQVESNPPIQQSGNSIRIGYNLPDDVRRHVAIDYEITVPANASVQAHTGSGNVQVSGVRSGVLVQTGSGDIRLRDLGSRLQAHTGSGDIQADDVAAPFSAQTGSGEISASLTGSGDVDVHTGSGSIRVRGIKGGVQARSGSGDIETDGSITGPWQLHSGSGNIRLAVGSAHGFNLDAHTSSGSIHSDLPVTVQGSLGHQQLKGTVQGGGPEVEISTSSGDIEIR